MPVASIMAWTHSDFPAHHFSVGNEVYEAQAYPISLSPDTASVSVSPSAGLQQHDATYRNEYTPRFQPDPYTQTFPHQQYHSFENYSCSTSPSTARGRSSSGDAASYMSTSTLSMPTTPQEGVFLNGTSNQYQIQSSHQICSNAVAPTENYLTRTPSIEEHGEKAIMVPSNASSPSSDK